MGAFHEPAVDSRGLSTVTPVSNSDLRRLDRTPTLCRMSGLSKSELGDILDLVVSLVRTYEVSPDWHSHFENRSVPGSHR